MKFGNQARETASTCFYGAGFLLYYYNIEKLSISAMALSLSFLIFCGVIVRLALMIKANVRDLISRYLSVLLISLTSILSLGDLSIVRMVVILIATHLTTVAVTRYIILCKFNP